MKEYPSYQRHLKEPEGDKYFFPEGVVIWPQNTEEEFCKMMFML